MTTVEPPMETLERHGAAILAWLADYHRRRVRELPVQSRAAPGDVYRALPERAPEHGEPFADVLRDLDAVVVPGLTHWQSPRFFGFFPANVSEPAILGELLSAGLGVQGMLWATSPACTEVEMRVLDWMVDLLGLPDAFRSSGAGGGVIQDTASSATLCALLAARERTAPGWSARGASPGDLVVYGTAEAHSSLRKSVRIAGIGEAALREIAVDADGAMEPDALAAAIDADRRAGLRPCFVCATVGTTATLAFDPVPEIGRIAASAGAWLHVDAAHAGTAAICPEFAHLHAGLEHADSYCWNPHKWMLTNFDCDCFYVRDRKALIDAMSVTPEYLRNPASETGAVFDYRDWHVPLGRRFRALKLWMVLRHYGAAGIRDRVRRHVALAASLADRVEADPNLELWRRPALNLVCLAHRAGDEATAALLERLNDSGRVFMSHARAGGRMYIRCCIGQTHVGPDDVDVAWALLRDEAARIADEGARGGAA